ncbi:hypothetical protein ACQKWADRAFT_319280 [Trichoderma austrokoningii]
MVNFSQLPYELREKIWLSTIEPRLVGLIPRRVGRGLWSVKCTVRPPVALRINRESRNIVKGHYEYLEARTVLNHKLVSWPYQVWPIVLDSSPCIPFNFDIDTLHFADTTPPDKPLPDAEARRKNPKTPTNAMDLLLLKEYKTEFGPGFRATIDATSRILDWPYLLEAKVLNGEHDYGENPELLNWTRIRHVRFDFNMFLSDLAIHWGHMQPFLNWMQHAAIHVETPNDAIRSCDLIMVSGRGNKRSLERTLRVALRPEKEYDAGYQSLSPIEQLEQYGAVVFEDVLPTPESTAILYEVVDPLIGNEAISKWKQFSIDQRVSRPQSPLRLHSATPFGTDMEVLWLMAKVRRGLAHGAMSPVHGLCLADYGIDGGFRGRT